MKLPCKLSDYYLLGNSGLRVSPLCLGTMTFGPEWGWGSTKDEARDIFDLYVEQGGNFIDTANYYTNGTSEEYLGEFMRQRRNQMVVATKYTLCTDPHDPNAGGNHRKNMMRSIEGSLKRLQTDYIDLFWLHMWEFRTPIEEILRGLDDLVRQGKVHYIAFSDTPAWKISEANTIARLRGWTPCIATQVQYNLIERTAEAELVPMGKEHGVAIQPWSPLAGGLLTGKYKKEDITSSPPDESRKAYLQDFGLLSQESLKIVDEVKTIAHEIGHTPSQVSLNWLLQKPGVVSPIIGARRVDQLQDNLGALDFCLTKEQMEVLNSVSRFQLPFPENFYVTDRIHRVLDGDNRIEGGIEELTFSR